MNLLDILDHLLNFAAPALVLALLVPLTTRLLIRKKGFPIAWWLQFAVNLTVGLGVLAGGLWWGGRDGKMLTYTALVVAVATCQWLMARGWRR
jgi:hypothetical protein